MKKIGIVIAALLFAALLFALPASAAEAEELPTALQPNVPRANDGDLINSGTFLQNQNYRLSSEKEIASLLIRFDLEPAPFTITLDGEEKSVEPRFLHQFVSVKELFGKTASEMELRFDRQAEINEITAFSDGDLPSWVQVWQAPEGAADVLVSLTHSGDEQLFFAGLLPALTDRGLIVQTVYFTDHDTVTDRRHELLNGLWEAGVRRYPVLTSPVSARDPGAPLAEEAAYEAALAAAVRAGHSYEDLVAFQIEQIRRFQPLLLVGPDLAGEYHDGQKILNARTLIEAAENAGKADAFSESAEKYGVWEVKKFYLHLYSENPVELNLDAPLASYGGKTAFQVSQSAFRLYNLLQNQWYASWLLGENGEITLASQVSLVPDRYASFTDCAFSPCRYGLYSTLVGADEAKNDLMEHLESRAEEAARLQKEKEEAAREALERESEEARRRAEEEAQKARLEAEELERKKNERAAAAEESGQKREVIFILLGLGAIAALAAVLLVRRIVLKRRRRSIADREGTFFD